MADLYLTPAEKYTAALGGFYYGDLPEPGTVYTQLIKDILDGSTPDKEPKNILARFIYSLYISDLGDPYPRYELAKLLYWKLHNITPTKSGSVLTVTIDDKEDYMTINTDLSRLWYKVLFGSKTDIITEFPYIFNTMQNKLSDWELFGNTEASGTSTPDSPVMPQGTGERTGQLITRATFSPNYLRFYVADLKTIVETEATFTLSFKSNITFRNNSVYLNTPGISSARVIATVSGTGNVSTTFTLTEADISNIKNSSKPYFHVYKSDTDFSASTDIMLNSGSTPLPYEPYGYKIPISSASTTTPVYLGEVESIRRIKKLVLTGNEDITATTGNAPFVLPLLDIIQVNNRQIILFACSHYEAVSNSASWSQYNSCVSWSFSGGINVKSLVFRDTSCTDVDAWKAYLAAQYAAGTPVCVWYVLATPTTGIVNEPLMKIGDYVDSMSRAQTGIDIPTVIGQNTLDVLTTVKPSSMSIEYTSTDENRSRSKRISLLKSPLKKRLIK